MKVIKGIQKAFNDEEILSTVGLLLGIVGFLIISWNAGGLFNESGNAFNLFGTIQGVIVLFIGFRVGGLGGNYKKYSRFYFRYKKPVENWDRLVKAMSKSDLLELQQKHESDKTLTWIIDVILEGQETDRLWLLEMGD